MNPRIFIILGAVLMALGVGLGAYGSHGLRGNVDDYFVDVFNTAVNYHMYHALGLILVGVLFEKFQNRAIAISGYLMVLGILCFSGSLYSFVLLNFKPGLVTPLGGVLFMVAWITLALSFFKNSVKEKE